MKLRHKFSLLAFLYVTTLAANFALCSWCILLYYHSFVERRVAESAAVAQVEQTRTARQSHDWGTPGTSVEGLAEHVADQGKTETYILRVLGANALCGLALGFLGLRLARRWVIQPIASLRDAAVEIGQGNFSYRISSCASDELGELAKEVNSMASSIVSMQDQLIEHERRQVGNQALRCIVHNIRSPLTGIRWLAEAIEMRDDIDTETIREQGRIVEIVDRLLAWLQSFRESMKYHGRYSDC